MTPAPRFHYGKKWVQPVKARHRRSWALTLRGRSGLMSYRGGWQPSCHCMKRPVASRPRPRRWFRVV